MDRLVEINSVFVNKYEIDFIRKLTFTALFFLLEPSVSAKCMVQLTTFREKYSA